MDDRDRYTDKEIERRMQDAIKRALSTPPKPFTKPVKGDSKKKPTKSSKKQKAPPKRG